MPISAPTIYEMFKIILLSMATLPFIIILGLFFEGVDRKLHARLQRRIGPPIIQPFYDFFKLLAKETLTPMTASSILFNAVPIIALVCSMSAAILVFIGPLTQLLLVDLLLVLYFLAMIDFMIIVAGSSSGNPYGAIGASREMTQIIAYELPFIISVTMIAMKAGGTFSLFRIAEAQVTGTLTLTSPSVILLALAALLCLPAQALAVPFDIPEAKTEIIHGALIEYSGRNLAFMRLSKWIKKFAVTSLTVILFFYHPIPHLQTSWLIDMTFLILKALIVMVIAITIPRTIFARLKIAQSFGFYWRYPLALSIIGAILMFLNY